MTPIKFKNHQEWLEWEKGSAERLRKWKEEHTIRYKKAFNDQIFNYEVKFLVKYLVFVFGIMPDYRKKWSNSVSRKLISKVIFLFYGLSVITIRF